MSDQPSIPIPLTPERRLTRVAAILARGIIRLRRPAPAHDRLGVLADRDIPSVGDARITPPCVRLSDRCRESCCIESRRHEPHQRAVPFFKLTVHEVIARDHRYAGQPGFVDREAVGFVVARVAKDVGDAEPIADAALARS